MAAINRVSVTASTVVVLVGGLAGLAFQSGTPEAAPTGAAQSMSTTLTADLADRAVRAAESDPRFRREITSHSDRIGCVAYPFGTDPESSQTADQARIVYAQMLCAEVTGDGSLDGAEQAVMPVAVHLGEQGWIAVPTEGEDVYPASVQGIIPRRLWGAAFAGVPDQDAVARLRRRVAELAGPRPSTS